jgi:hypothetical protein
MCDDAFAARHMIMTCCICFIITIGSCFYSTLWSHPYTVKPLYYVHTRNQKVSLYLLTRSLYFTWFIVLNNEVYEYRKGPKFSVLINEVYLLKRFYCIALFKYFVGVIVFYPIKPINYSQTLTM